MTLRRMMIAQIMGLVALVAVDLWAMRGMSSHKSPAFILLVTGVLPMANVLWYPS